MTMAAIFLRGGMELLLVNLRRPKLGTFSEIEVAVTLQQYSARASMRSVSTDRPIESTSYRYTRLSARQQAAIRDPSRLTISTGVHTPHESEHLRSRIVEFLGKKIREIRFDEARSRKPGFATPTRISSVQRPWWMVVVDTFVYFFTICQGRREFVPAGRSKSVPPMANATV